MAKEVGGNTWIGFKNEATWGSFLPAGWYIRFATKETLALSKEAEEDEFLSGGCDDLEPSSMVGHPDGQIITKNSFEGLEYLFHHLLSHSAAERANATPVASTSTWTWTSGNPLPIGLSVSVNRTLNLWQYAGCKVAGAKIHFVSKKPGDMTFDVVSATEAKTTLETIGGKTFKGYIPILSTYGTVASTNPGGSLVSLLQDVELDIRNPLDSDLYPCYGSTIIEPERSGNQKIKGTITYWVDSTMLTNVYTPFAAGTTVAITFTYSSGTKYITGTTPYSLSFSMPACKLVGKATPVSENSGITTVKTDFTAFYNGTNPRLTATLVNGNNSDLS